MKISAPETLKAIAFITIGGLAGWGLSQPENEVSELTEETMRDLATGSMDMWDVVRECKHARGRLVAAFKMHSDGKEFPDKFIMICRNPLSEHEKELYSSPSTSPAL